MILTFTPTRLDRNIRQKSAMILHIWVIQMMETGDTWKFRVTHLGTSVQLSAGLIKMISNTWSHYFP